MEKELREMNKNLKEMDKYLKDLKELFSQFKKESCKDNEQMKKSLNKVQRSIDRALILFGTLLVGIIMYFSWNWKIFNFILIVTTIIIYLLIKY